MSKSTDNYMEAINFFHAFDKDNNGLIDHDEFALLVDALGAKKITAQELQAGFTKIDTDNNGSIDFDEFMAWWGDQ
ncbi:MAG: EF-hand domain-containing protein [Gammaproteobacteria bacterium]